MTGWCNQAARPPPHVSGPNLLDPGHCHPRSFTRFCRSVCPGNTPQSSPSCLFLHLRPLALNTRPPHQASSSWERSNTYAPREPHTIWTYQRSTDSRVQPLDPALARRAESEAKATWHVLNTSRIFRGLVTAEPCKQADVSVPPPLWSRQVGWSLPCFYSSRDWNGHSRGNTRPQWPEPCRPRPSKNSLGVGQAAIESCSPMPQSNSRCHPLRTRLGFWHLLRAVPYHAVSAARVGQQLPCPSTGKMIRHGFTSKPGMRFQCHLRRFTLSSTHSWNVRVASMWILPPNINLNIFLFPRVCQPSTAPPDRTTPGCRRCAHLAWHKLAHLLPFFG